MVSLLRRVFRELNYKCQVVLIPAGSYRVYYRVTPWRYAIWQAKQWKVCLVNYLLIKHSMRHLWNMLYRSLGD